MVKQPASHLLRRQAVYKLQAEAEQQNHKLHATYIMIKYLDIFPASYKPSQPDLSHIPISDLNDVLSGIRGMKMPFVHSCWHDRCHFIPTQHIQKIRWGQY